MPRGTASHHQGEASRRNAAIATAVPITPPEKVRCQLKPFLRHELGGAIVLAAIRKQTDAHGAEKRPQRRFDDSSRPGV